MAISPVEGIIRWTLSDISPRPERVTYVRRQARLVLQLWRLTGFTWPAEVLTSELPVNVLRHAGTPSQSRSPGTG